MAESEEIDVLHRVNRNKITLRDLYASTRFEELTPPPPLELGAATMARCRRSFERYVAPATGAEIPDKMLDVPKWVFLEYLVRHEPILVHGSTNGTIADFEPRAANDNIVDGHVPRVYAASSGLLAMFYAIADRARLAQLGVGAIVVAYMPFTDAAGNEREGFHFAVDARALPHRPWCTGMVYLLNRAPFTADYMRMQWHSSVVARPLAKVAVTPDDFPLLAQIRGIHWPRVAHYAGATLRPGFPWANDAELYPGQLL